jgi:DDE superfamily endonuclease
MIMLDHFQCHRQQSFVKRLSSIGCDVDYIPAGYPCVLQRVDVGFNAPFKRRIKQQHSTWCIENYVDIDEHAPFPVPERDNIIEWVNQSLAEIDPAIIHKTFLSIGYHYPEDHGIDYCAQLQNFQVENTVPVDTVHHQCKHTYQVSRFFFFLSFFLLLYFHATHPEYPTTRCLQAHVVEHDSPLLLVNQCRP